MSQPTAFSRIIAIFCLAAALAEAAAGAGLKDATVLIIRHAEKPDAGDGLAPAGETRAKAYVEYFKNFKVGSEPVKLDAIFAAADSRNSRRPRITVEPLAQAMGLTVNSSYKDKAYQELAGELRAHGEGKHLLICWHHGEIPDLLAALGAAPDKLLPGGHWPGEEYDWIIALRFDHNGRLINAERLQEGLTGSHPRPG